MEIEEPGAGSEGNKTQQPVVTMAPLTWRERINWWKVWCFDPYLPCPYAYLGGHLFTWRNENLATKGWYWPKEVEYGGFAPD